ncbi:MAG: hypothetical protein DME02_05275 [Candidatus Rokuibacteriota bacterium]|nr:MAG: hypothetical protein DME02_05275 [Candidatus Rokubacteria bacterium]
MSAMRSGVHPSALCTRMIGRSWPNSMISLPRTPNTWPVTSLAASDARKTATGAMCSGPMRLTFSTPLFGASRLVLHRMLGVKGVGHYLRNLALDAGLVLLLTMLLFLASVMTAIFQWFQEFFLEAMGVPWQWLYWTAVAFSLSLSTAMFYFVYRYVPRRQPARIAALPGAILTALLWEVAKQLFRLYIRRVGVYDQIYGPLGVAVAFVSPKMPSLAAA